MRKAVSKSVLKRNVLSVVFLSLGSMYLCLNLVYANNLIQVGRYASAKTGPTQAEINPLDAIAAFRFPSQIKTVGQALGVVLENTGFKLENSEKLSLNVKSTLAMPLPVTNRALGFMTIKEAIIILMGKNVYTVHINLLKRTVNFRLKQEYQPKISYKQFPRVIRKKTVKKQRPLKGERNEFI